MVPPDIIAGTALGGEDSSRAGALVPGQGVEPNPTDLSLRGRRADNNANNVSCLEAGRGVSSYAQNTMWHG